MKLAALPCCLALASCSAIADQALELPGTKVRYLGGHDKADVALLVLAWVITFEVTTGEPPQVDGTMIEERTLSEDLDGYLSNTGTVVVASKPSVSSMAIMHELTHQHLRRSTGDADHDHVDGEGPWTKEHDDVIQDATALVRRCGL